MKLLLNGRKFLFNCNHITLLFIAIFNCDYINSFGIRVHLHLDHLTDYFT